WQTAITAAVFCLLLALSLFFLVIYLKKQHRLRRLQSERDLFVLAAEFERLKNENKAAQQLFSQERQDTDSTIATLNSEIAKSRNLCNELFISRFSWIDKLGNIYLDSDLASNTQQALHKKVKEELSAVKLSRFKKELVDIVNTYYDNLITRIEAQRPSLTASEMDYVVLSCVGLSPRVIAFLLSKTVPTIYNIKSKVRTKLKAEAPALFGEYCALASATH
ncbi:MAG: hypothetical protein J6J53_05715, partial [Muribaculaceae bacterium]|nr:hypothetical protein [Muribaculaceae bacterium]